MTRHSWFLWAARRAICAGALSFAQTTTEAAVESLEIVTATGSHKFQIEVARTEQERRVGLMNRRSMPPNHGMLFLFATEQQISMWMKNTFISLDMIFVARNGRVTDVARDAVPMSEAIITSKTPAYAVIELNAGAARAIDLAVGDQVRHSGFKP
jgi:uncharacterized membrane protein (UPF0127 family)